MAHQLRGFADQAVVLHPADVHHVVGHQLVTALDQLQRRFALAHAAVAGDQQARAEHVHQHAVAGFPGGQPVAQVGDQVQLELGGLLVGGVDGDLPGHAHHQHLVKAGVAAADDDAGQGIVEVLLQPLPAGQLVQLGQVGHLHLAQQLGPFVGKEIPVVGELHARAVGVADLDVQRLGVGGHHAGQAKGIDKISFGNHGRSSCG